MFSHQIKVLLACALFYCSSAVAQNTLVSIPLKNNTLPANDLVYETQGSTEILTPEKAWRLKTEQKIDLSLLNPDPTSDLWKNISPPPIVNDEALPIQDQQTVQFLNVLATGAGRLKFNVQVEQGKTLSIILSKTVHTLLLRKELLRKLGYQVPEMKYLKKISVTFPDLATRDYFLSTQIPLATNGAAERWQAAPLSKERPLTLDLQDVIAIEATPQFYNLALGPPTKLIPNTTELQPQNQRILRALSLIYGLANIEESLNQVEWVFGKIENDALTFFVPDQANFTCTLDDALWILRKVEKLTPQDFKEIVQGARFPDAVAKLLLEKIVSRRNTVLSTLNIRHENYPYDSKVSDGSALIKGKMVQQDWPGYASRFSYGDPESPLKKMGFYALSLLESNVINNLVSKANSELTQVIVKDQLKQATQKWLQTGQTQQVGMQAWVAPIVNGGVDLSRNLVLGGYLGTGNLVQLADTFGFHLNLGISAGFYNPYTLTSIQGSAQGSVAISLTHLKPITSLKKAVTEPIQNMFVPLLFGRTSHVLKRISNYQNHTGPESPEEIKKKIAEELEQLKKYLEVGEALILTESLSGLEQLIVYEELPGSIGPRVGVVAGSNQVLISRIQFFRKDHNTITVYKDDGDLVGASAAFDVSIGGPVPFSILNISAKGVMGQAKTKMFTVNINPDPVANPTLYSSAHALASTLNTGSIELLEANLKYAKVSVKFKDRSSQMQFVHLIRRTLKTNGKIQVELPDGTQGDYISLTNGKQKGKNYQALATQVGNYIVDRITQDQSYSVSTPNAVNPGQTFLGESNTRDAQFQARVAPDIQEAFLGVQYRWEGWNINRESMIGLVNLLNTRYGFKLYSEDFLNDTVTLKLYQLALQINLYEKAMNQLAEMDEVTQAEIVSKYKKIHRCAFGIKPACAAIMRFNQSLRHYRRGFKNVSQQSQLLFKVATNFEQFVNFNDLVKAVGGPSNLYVYSQITGFRSGSESLIKPIDSNTFGKKPEYNANGILNTIQQILGISSGEFQMKWLRDLL